MSELSALLDRANVPEATSVLTIVINLLVAAGLGIALAWHYERYGRTLTNRMVLARVLPFIALATVLVITIVQTSLALALGLVGALSIVRFRTPIKEPEELAYLFMSIAIGLGLGANQRLITVIAFGVILGFLALWSRRGVNDDPHQLYLNIEVENKPDSSEVTYNTVQELLAQSVAVADLRRLDTENGSWNATFYIDCPDQQSIIGAVDNLKRNVPNASISLVDRQQSLGL